MAIYYILMAVILGLAYPLCIRRASKKKSLIYVLIVFIYLFIMSSLRYGIGNDYFNYRKYLYGVTDNNLSYIDTIKALKLEPGYALLLKLTELLGGEYIVLNILTAFLILVPTGYIIYKYSKMPWLSCWLYLTITFFYNSLNFTRQSLSVAVIFLGYRFFAEKKHWAVILFILAGSMFHVSAIILLPIYIISLIKPSPKVLGIIGSCGIIVFIFSRQILNFVLTYILPGYAKYNDTIFLTMGLSAKFIVIPAIFMIILFAAYYMGWKDKYASAALFANFGFYNFFIWLFIVKHFILERFTMPIYIFMLIALPEAIDFFKTMRSAKKDRPSVRTDKEVLYTQAKRYLYPSVLCVSLISTFIYNDFCIGEGVHGVFPYRSIIRPIAEFDKYDMSVDYRAMFVNARLLDMLDILNRGGDYTVLICINGDVGTNLEYPYRRFLKKLGFTADFNRLEGQSYIGAVSGGKAVFEDFGNEVLTREFTLYDNTLNIRAVSGGTNAGAQASVIVNGREFLPEGNGIHFAVFDNDLKKIVAAQAYDTSTFAYTYINSTAFYGYE